MSRLPILLCFLWVSAAGQQRDEPRLSTQPLSSEQLSIYRDFLEHYSKGLPLKVADTTIPLGSFNSDSCKKLFGAVAKAGPVHRFPPEIEGADNIDLVDRSTQRKRNARDGSGDEKAVPTPFHGVLTLSEVFFDRAHKLAAFSYSYVCPGRCGQGGVMIYELDHGHWDGSKKRQCDGWIS